MNSWIFSMVWPFAEFVIWLASFTPSEKVALFAAFLVLVGVIAEEVAEIKFFEDKKRERIKKRVKRLAVGLLVLGLAGDVVGIVKGQAEMASLTKEAGDAATSAKTAHEEAAAAHELAQSASNVAVPAKQKADEAKGEADSVTKQAAGLTRQMSATTKELAREITREQAAEQQLESEKVKRLKLAVSLHDRDLFDQSGIINLLSSLPPHRVILVYLNEHEPKQFAEQIAVVFSVLKWPYFGRPISEESAFFPGVSVTSGYHLSSSGSPSEITRQVEELEAGENLAGTMRKIFANAHVDLAVNQFTQGNSNESPSTILIGIGPKPNTELEEALRELGTPDATPLGGGARGITMGGNRTSIPLDPTFKPDSVKP